jgi:hypothetical protein
MKALIILIVALLAVTLPGLAQPDSLWSRTYGGAGSEYSLSVVQTEDGGYILGCSTNSLGAGNFDEWLIKTNAQGDTLWCHTYGGTQEERVANAGPTADGGYFMAGTTRSYGAGNYDFWLVKTDADGNSLWNRTYGGAQEDWAWWGQQTLDGGYILTGYTTSFGAGGRDFWLVKTNANGDSSWSRTFGGPDWSTGFYVIQTADNGYMIAGETHSFGEPNGDFRLVKTNANGDSLWAHTYGKPWEDTPYCVRQTQDGGYVVVGKSARSTGIPDVWLVKTSANGDSLWSYTYGVSGDYETGLMVVQTSDGGYTVAACTQCGGGPYIGDAWLIRTDNEGNVLWSRTYGSGADEATQDFQLTADGGYAIAGLSNAVGNYDVWLLKTGPDPLSVGDHFVFQPSSLIFSAFPNPFNSSTAIAFDLPRVSRISLRVFDVLGREVAVLKDGMLEAGNYRVMFNGNGLASGIYFARLDAGKFSQTKKLMLLK